MNQAASPARATRMLFLGDATLTDGFRLIGFETRADPTEEELEEILHQLVTDRQNAFVVLDHRLSTSSAPLLARVRAEGGRIIITEVPPLDAPEQFHCKIDDEVRSLLGEQRGGGCSDE
ncbi:MAG: ATPase [gamma proteobacterium symbiont of Phacoides pectinatus]